LTGVSVRLVLDRTTVAPGQNICAELIVENNSGHPIPKTCDTWAQVGLKSKAILFKPVWDTRYCLGVPLPEGTSRWPVPILSTYTDCMGETPLPGDDTPRCIDGRIPPLPPGTYSTAVQYSVYEDGFPQPTQLKVTVTH